MRMYNRKIQKCVSPPFYYLWNKYAVLTAEAFMLLPISYQ